MRKILFYAMREEKMCFVHVLLNALSLREAGNEVKLVFEGSSVKLPAALASEGNPLYRKVLEAGIIAGICKACSQQLGVLEVNKKLGLPLLDDMSGHAGMRPFAEQGFEIVVA